jgi:hypothetical protein
LQFEFEERVFECLLDRESVRGVYGEECHDEVLALLAALLPRLVRFIKRIPAGAHALPDLLGALAIEGQPAADEQEQHHPQRPQVTSIAIPSSGQHFGRREGQRATTGLHALVRQGECA